MAISDKITSIQNLLKDDWDSVESLIGDTELDKNIENISSALDDLYNDLPKVTGSGTSITLDDTRKGRLESTLSGNTSQTTYSGKNLLHQDQYLTTRTTNGITYTNNGDGTFNVTGTATANTNIQILAGASQIGLESGKTYYFYSSKPYNGTDFNMSIPFAQDGAQKYLTANNTIATSGTLTNIKLSFYVGSGVTVNAQNVKLMLVEGSTPGDYEPFVGGTASPSPDYPQEVHIVRGDNKITVCGNNLFNKDNIFVGYLKEDGTLSTDTAYRTSDFMPIRPNITYYKTSTGSPRTKYFDINKVPLNTTTYWDVPTGGSAGTFTTPNNAYYLRFSFPFAGSSAIDADTIMVKEGTDTTYEPYQGKTYNIDLPEGMELCKIGNYQDYFYKDSDKWYLHKEIGKVVLNGSSNRFTQIFSTDTSGINRYRTNEIPVKLQASGQIANVFCDKLLPKTITHTYLKTQGISVSDAINMFIIYIDDISTYTLAQANNWLRTNNLEVYYLLATPTDIEVEYQPLLEQLEAYYHAKSRATQTNISQENNDLPFEIDASALEG